MGRDAVTLVLLERRDHVAHVARHDADYGGAALLAVTAEAAQALEEHELAHHRAEAFADTCGLASADAEMNRQVYTLAHEIERYVGERCASAQFDGPGFLTGQAYYLQYSLEAVAARTLIARDAILALAPHEIVLFDDAVDTWFAGDGYASNPWIAATQRIANDEGVGLELVAAPPPSGDAGDVPSGGAVWSRRAGSLWRSGNDLLRRFASPPFGRLPGEMRLLLADSTGYDWTPVLEALRSTGDATTVALQGRLLDARPWTYYYADIERAKAADDRPTPDDQEIGTLTRLFDEWRFNRASAPELPLLGVDFFEPLACHLKALTCLSPSLARHADRMSDQVLRLARPRAVCFYAMPWLAAKRLAFKARARGVAVVCYQHGGAYGTHAMAKSLFLEPAHADYFLTYGAGITPGADTAQRAQHVPVGSARVAATAGHGQRLSRSRIRVLWIGEFSTKNTVGATFQVEDTKRYRLETSSLRVLALAPHLEVVFRPYPSRMATDGTTRWLRRTLDHQVRLEPYRHPIDLIRASDIVVTDASSNTVWNEVLAARVPLIVYCDPAQTKLVPAFADTLDRACLWCRSEIELQQAVQRLASADAASFVDEVRRRDPSEYLRKYVLHDDDSTPVRRVIAFLADVCAADRPVPKRQAVAPDASPKPHATVSTDPVVRSW